MTNEWAKRLIRRAYEENNTVLYLSWKQMTNLPSEIGKLENLTILYLAGNQLTHLPPEIGELKNLTTLCLSGNQLTELPPEIGKLKKLTKLYLSENHLTQLPLEIRELKNLTELYLSKNLLIQLPPDITELNNLIELDLSENPINSPPPEVVSMGLQAIFTYLKNPKTTENNEAKLILVGDERVGKTCLAHRLISDKFLENSKITEGINISKWKIPSPISGKSEIKLNVWDFGGQEIYHATHQFFLTKRSVYLLLWNARKKEEKDDDYYYYWLHTIEAFGEDSPIILIMSKKNVSDDDLNLKSLKSRFPQIADSLKVDSKDGDGIFTLKEKIQKIAWDTPLMLGHSSNENTMD
jgi:internalin A